MACNSVITCDDPTLTSAKMLRRKKALIEANNATISAEIHFNSGCPENGREYGLVLYPKGNDLLRLLSEQIRDTLAPWCRRYRHNETKSIALPCPGFKYKYFAQNIGGIIIEPLFIDAPYVGGFFREKRAAVDLGKILGKCIYDFYYNRFLKSPVRANRQLVAMRDK